MEKDRKTLDETIERLSRLTPTDFKSKETSREEAYSFCLNAMNIISECEENIHFNIAQAIRLSNTLKKLGCVTFNKVNDNLKTYNQPDMWRDLRLDKDITFPLTALNQFINNYSPSSCSYSMNKLTEGWAAAWLKNQTPTENLDLSDIKEKQERELDNKIKYLKSTKKITNNELVILLRKAIAVNYVVENKGKTLDKINDMLLDQPSYYFRSTPIERYNNGLGTLDKDGLTRPMDRETMEIMYSKLTKDDPDAPSIKQIEKSASKILKQLKHNPFYYNLNTDNNLNCFHFVGMTNNIKHPNTFKEIEIGK